MNSIDSILCAFYITALQLSMSDIALWSQSVRFFCDAVSNQRNRMDIKFYWYTTNKSAYSILRAYISQPIFTVDTFYCTWILDFYGAKSNALVHFYNHNIIETECDWLYTLKWSFLWQLHAFTFDYFFCVVYRKIPTCPVISYAEVNWITNKCCSQ